jgi:hypothetical protein
MSSTATVLDVRCFNCEEPLLRITRSEVDDFVFCAICGGVLSYEEVLTNAPGLVAGLLTADELCQLRIEAGC